MPEAKKDQKNETVNPFAGLGDMGGFGKFFQLIGQIFTSFFGGNFLAGLFGGGKNNPAQQDPARSGAAQTASPSTPSLFQRGREAVSKGWDALKAKFVSDMPADKTYTKAHRSGNDIVFSASDGDQVVKVRESTRTASRSWANNNPGNIEYGAFSKKFGAIGTDGRFAIFPTVDAGFEAQKGLLKGDNYKNLTLRDAIYRWAPPSENNSAHYAQTVASRAGLNENTRIRDMSDAQLDRMVRTMASHEGWKAGKVAVIDTNGPRVASVEPRAGGPRPGASLEAVQPISGTARTAFTGENAPSPSVTQTPALGPRLQPSLAALTPVPSFS